MSSPREKWDRLRRQSKVWARGPADSVDRFERLPLYLQNQIKAHERRAHRDYLRSLNAPRRKPVVIHPAPKGMPQTGCIFLTAKLPNTPLPLTAIFTLRWTKGGRPKWKCTSAFPKEGAFVKNMRLKRRMINALASHGVTCLSWSGQQNFPASIVPGMVSSSGASVGKLIPSVPVTGLETSSGYTCQLASHPADTPQPPQSCLTAAREAHGGEVVMTPRMHGETDLDIPHAKRRNALQDGLVLPAIRSKVDDVPLGTTAQLNTCPIAVTSQTCP